MGRRTDGRMIWARPELVPRRRADKVSTGRPVFEAEDDVVVRLTGGEVRLVVQRGLPETRVNEWGSQSGGAECTLKVNK